MKPAAKPQVMIAPDGMEFNDRKLFREYMVEKFYSFKNLTVPDEEHIKHSGEIDGQSFDMFDCENCNLLILDHSEQIQVDNLVNCSVFVGACSSSVFIRNSKDCVFYTCSRQLRITGVENSVFYSSCQAEIHIELSSALKFGCFNGGYPDQSKHFRNANLDPTLNLWYDIFDHSDPLKNGTNWTSLQQTEYEDPWFPLGECDVCVPITQPAAISNLSNGKNSTQVGEAFGIEQMIADAKALQDKKSQDQQESQQHVLQQQSQMVTTRTVSDEARHIARLGSEIAILVQVASAKGVDVAKWLTVESNHGLSNFHEFSSKITSLGLMLGVEEDEDSKRELAAATCTASLHVVADTCGQGHDDSGHLLVDILYFLKLCEAKASLCYEDEEDEEDEEVVDGRQDDSLQARFAPAPTLSSSSAADGQYSRSIAAEMTREVSNNNNNNNKVVTSKGKAGALRYDSEECDEDDNNFVAYASSLSPSATEYALDAARFSGAAVRRPLSAPAGSRGRQQGDIGLDLASAPRVDTDRPTTSSSSHSRQQHPPEQQQQQQRRRPQQQQSHAQHIKQQRGAGAASGDVTATALPRSPYDEEVSFDLHSEENTTVSGRGTSAAAGAGSTSRPTHLPKSSQEPSMGQRKPRYSDGYELDHEYFLMHSINNPHHQHGLDAKSGQKLGAWQGHENDWKEVQMLATSQQQMPHNTGKDIQRGSDRESDRRRSASASSRLSRSSLQYDAKSGHCIRPKTPTFSSSTNALPSSRSASADRVRGDKDMRRMSTGNVVSRSRDTHEHDLSGADLRRASSAGRASYGRELSASNPNITLYAMQDMVEDQVRSVVKKTDLYHMLQVHLGFIKAYTVVPARGAIVSSRPRPWLSARDLHVAFLATRLYLSDAKLFTLMKLVCVFAQEYTHNQQKRQDVHLASQESDLGPVLQSGRKLSAEWFKKYLVHLRLTKRSQSSSAWLSREQEEERERVVQGQGHENKTSADDGDSRESAAGAAASAEQLQQQVSQEDNGVQAQATEPLPWQDWLSHKLIDGHNLAKKRPKDFRRALAGQQHSLSKEEVNRMLLSHEIIPAKDLEEELTHRIQCWIVDTSGRREFVHALHLEILKWEKTEKADFRRLTAESRKEISAEFKRKVIKEKTEELRTLERTDAAITKEIYWKYDDFCRENNYFSCGNWGEWLRRHRKKADDHLERFKRDAADRKKACGDRATMGHTVAPVSVLEDKLSSAAKSLNTYHSVELRKCLLELRKAALRMGIANGNLVSKEEFDRHFQRVLAPLTKNLTPDLKQLVSAIASTSATRGFEVMEGQAAASGSGSGRGGGGGIFVKSEAAALANAEALEKEKAQSKAVDFQDWNAKKVIMREEAIERQREKLLIEEAEEEERAKAARKAYRQWMKLRRNNKYVSKADGQLHVVPGTATVSHKSRWSKENGLSDYYLDMEKNF